jgi:hypothetical protein
MQKAGPAQAGKAHLLRHRGSARIGIVPQHQPAPLEQLLALAKRYAEFAMRNIGHVPRAMLAAMGTTGKQLHDDAGRN